MPLLPAAVGIIFNDDQTQVLLVKRRDMPVWVLPGGGIEPPETAEQALIREIKEETGYHITILRKCAEYYPLNRLASFTSVFICHISAGHACLSAETTAIAFYPLSQLPPAFFHLHNGWLQETLNHPGLIQRPLTEVSYFAVFKYFMRHPLRIMRYSWTRVTKH